MTLDSPDHSVAEPLWLGGGPRPRRIEAADDTLNADAAYRLAAAGTAMHWMGDFQNARQLLQAMTRRFESRNKPARQSAVVDDGRTAFDPAHFHRYRMQQAQRARLLGTVLIPLQPSYVIPLRRSPDVAAVCQHAFGCDLNAAGLLPLRELQGMIGAYEWFRKGVPVAALDAFVYPHYGVFAPVRGEYVDLLAQAPLPPQCELAFDIGTGTGVLAMVLAKRGVQQIVATDASPRALECARDNVKRRLFSAQINVAVSDLFPAASAGRANLIVCNPPWLPGKAGSQLEHAVYDPDSQMLRGFLAGARERLAVQGEAWLIISDIAELLGLRSRDELLHWIERAGLKVIGRLHTRPTHAKTRDASDPLHAARAREVTSLWRLGAAS